MQKLNKVVVKTGTPKDFFDRVRTVMRNLDEGKPIQPSFTITFEDPAEMVHFLNESKIKLINVIRDHPDSITNIAKMAQRNRVSVSRDIKEMVKYGLVKISNTINPGHGLQKTISLTASKLKLEASV